MREEPIYVTLYFPKTTSVKHSPHLASGLIVIEPDEESLKVNVYSRHKTETSTSDFVKIIRSVILKALKDHQTILSLSPEDCEIALNSILEGEANGVVKNAVLNGIIWFKKGDLPAHLTETGEKLYRQLSVPEELEADTTLKKDLIYGLSVLRLFLKETPEIKYADVKDQIPAKRIYIYRFKGIPAEFKRVVKKPDKLDYFVEQFLSIPEKEIIDRLEEAKKRLLLSGRINVNQAELEEIPEIPENTEITISSDLKLRSRDFTIFPSHLQTPFNELSLDLIKAFLEFLAHHTETPTIKFLGFKEEVEENFYYPFVVKTFQVNPYNYDYFRFVIDLYRGDIRKWSFLVKTPELNLNVPEEFKDREKIIENYFSRKIDEFVARLPIPAPLYEIKKNLPLLVEKALSNKTSTLIEKSLLLLYTLSAYTRPIVEEELINVLFPDEEGFSLADRKRWSMRIRKLKEIALESLSYLTAVESPDLKEMGKAVVHRNLSLYISRSQDLSTVEMFRDSCQKLLGDACTTLNKKVNLPREYIRFNLEKILRKVRRGEMRDIIKQKLREKRNFLAVFLELFKETLPLEEQYEIESYEIEIGDSLDCELYSYHVVR